MMIDIKNFLKIYRVFDWFYYIGFIIIGFILNNALNLNIFNDILLGCLLLAYAFSLNEYYDRGRKGKSYFIIPGLITLILLPFFNFLQIIFSAIFLVLVTLYTIESFRLKSKPFICSISNGLGFTLLFLIGYTHGGILDFSGLIFTIFLFSLNMVAQFIHEATHLAQDKKNGIVTTAVFCGIRNVKKMSYFFLLITLISSMYLFYLKKINLIFLFLIVAFSSFFIWRIKTSRLNKKIRKEYKILGSIVGIIWLITLLIKSV